MARRANFKPYLFPGGEYGKISRADRAQDFHSVNDEREGGKYKLSEHHKPYLAADDDEGHPPWEWSFPPIPDVDPPWDFPCYGCEPEPNPNNPNPCAADNTCTAMKVSGPTDVECDETYTFTTFYVLNGCDLIYAFDMNWEVSCGEIVGIGAYMSWRAPKTCPPPDKCRICVNPSGYTCKDCITVNCTCADCCEAFTLTGSDTVAPGATWTGTISPACPDATCSVSSNSGCTLTCSVNAAGSQVEVPTGGSDCGGFVVTVSYSKAGCTSRSATKGVRITGGSWNDKGWCDTHPDYGTGCTEDFNAGCASTSQNQAYIEVDGITRLGWSSGSTMDWFMQCREWNEGGCDACATPTGSCPQAGDDSCATGVDGIFRVWEYDCSC